MSLIIHDLRPPWMTCASCGVTQPLASLHDVGKPGAAQWVCRNTGKCAAGKLERDRELAKFAEAFPELTVKR